MPFKSDEQRKAAFARMKGGKGGRKGPRAPKIPPHPGLEEIIRRILEEAGPKPWTPLPNGPGIPGTPGGPVELTGGGLYGTPGSDWYIYNQPDQPVDYGSYSGPGIGPYEQTFTEGWVPPTTLAGQLWVILVLGLDAYNGQPAPYDPWDPGYIGLLEAEFSANPGGDFSDVPNAPPQQPGNPWYPFQNNNNKGYNFIGW